MTGRSIHFFNKREIATLACSTALFQNVDFEAGNLDNATSGDTCFVRIVQSAAVAAKNRNVTFHACRFGPEADTGIRTVEYDVIFDNDGAVTSAEVTAGVT